MDPFSLAVGVSGLVGLTAQILKQAREYVHGIKHASEAASALATELQLLQNVLRRLDVFLRSDEAKSQSFDHTSVLVSSTGACRTKLEVLHNKLDAATKGRLLRALWPLNEKEHRQSVQELRAIAQCIQFALTVDQCSLLSRTSEEVTALLREQLGVFRTLTDISHSTAALELSIQEQTRILQNEHKARERERILDWTSAFDNESKHNAIRMPRVAGTAEWLTDIKDFKAWRIGVEAPSVLWCNGIPGSGKSVMTSLVLDRLRDDYVGQNVAIAFVYFDYRDQGTQSLDDVAANILRQVASHKSVLPISLTELYGKFGERNQKPQTQDLEGALLHACHDFDQVFILIDALDECDEAVRRKDFLPFLTMLQQTPRVRLFITSRPHPEDIRKALESAPQVLVQASDPDLRKYLRKQIEDSGNADIIDEDFRQYLINAVAKRAQNMFLLPALQIQSIVNEPTTGEMEDAIEAMPHDLHQAFYQTISRIQRQPSGRRRLGMNVLLWVSHAKGSLTVSELSEAMAVQPGYTYLNSRRRPSEVMMIDCCLGLVTVDQKSSIVRLVHHALQEFFRDQRKEIFPAGEDKIAEVCITYLFFDDFSRGCCTTASEIRRLILKFPLLRYASSYYGYHVRSTAACGQVFGLALKLIHSPLRRALSIQIQRYSQGYRHRYWEPNEVSSHNAFHCACSFGLQSIVRKILDSEDIDINGATHIGTTALIRAASSGHADLVRFLLSRGADPTKANWYGSALHCAAEAGRCESICCLLDGGVDVNLRDDFGRIPLHCATDKKHLLAIELLLDRGADPGARDHEGITLIHGIAAFGDEQLMRRLLRDKRVDISATTANKTTALHSAAIEGNANAVRMLLDVGAETDARCNDGYTALHLAAYRGREDVVRLLVEAGADVNVKSDDNTTARSLAAAAHHETIQELLLEHGADRGVFQYLHDVSQSADEDDDLRHLK